MIPAAANATARILLAAISPPNCQASQMASTKTLNPISA